MIKCQSLRDDAMTDVADDDESRMMMIPESLVIDEISPDDEWADTVEALEWDADLCRTARTLAARTFAYGF